MYFHRRDCLVKIIVRGIWVWHILWLSVYLPLRLLVLPDHFSSLLSLLQAPVAPNMLNCASIMKYAVLWHSILKLHYSCICNSNICTHYGKYGAFFGWKGLKRMNKIFPCKGSVKFPCCRLKIPFCKAHNSLLISTFPSWRPKLMPRNHLNKHIEDNSRTLLPC